MQFSITSIITGLVSFLLSCVLSMTVAERLSQNVVVYFFSFLVSFTGLQLILSPIARMLETLLTIVLVPKKNINTLEIDPNLCPALLHDPSSNRDDIFVGYEALPQKAVMPTNVPPSTTPSQPQQNMHVCQLPAFNKRFSQYA